MGRLDQIYAWLPRPTQHVAVSAFGYYWRRLRFGPGYAEEVEGFRRRDRLGRSELDAWCRRRLADVLRDALDTPHYAEVWTHGQRAAALAGRLADLPLLDKDPIRAAPRRFLRRHDKPLREFVFGTSGSTGTPIATIWTARELRASLALREVRSANWAGVSFRAPRATFSGRMVEPDPNSRGPYYRYNLAERQVYLSPFHLRPDTAAMYAAALRRHNTRWATGYAVSYYILAKLMVEQGLPPLSLDAVVTTSEKLTHSMREVMEQAYGCPIFEEYSTVENAVFASECTRGRLHVSMDAALVEILRPDGTPCEAGEVGEVVTTNLLRTYQSFVRFRVGDVAAWDAEPCSCGSVLPVLKEVVGRIEDVVVAPDGRRMVRFHGVFVDLPHVREGQIVQEKLDRVRVKVVCGPGYGPADEDEIVGRMRVRLGPSMGVVVEPVAHIPRTAAGKYQAVVSLLREKGLASVERTGIEP